MLNINENKYLESKTKTKKADATFHQYLANKYADQLETGNKYHPRYHAKFKKLAKSFLMVESDLDKLCAKAKSGVDAFGNPIEKKGAYFLASVQGILKPKPFIHKTPRTLFGTLDK